MRKLTFFAFSLSAIFFLVSAFVSAAECKSTCSDGDLDKCIAECNKLLDMSKQATAPHEKRVDELEAIISGVENNIKVLTGLIYRKKEQIGVQEKKLSLQQGEFENKVKDYYQKTYTGFGNQYLFATFFSSSDTGDILRDVAIKTLILNRDKRTIADMVLKLVELSDAKKKLEINQTSLADQKNSLEITLLPIKKLVSEAKSYQQQISSTIGGLSSRQQALLAEKTGSFQTTVGEVPAADDPASRPDYNPGFSPAFAGFSFGAPHRKGMSQYGAWGRAKSGQGVEDILRAYYGNVEIKKDYSTSININVSGYGSVNIETYVKRIYEMPSSWTDNDSAALKAQAVAARSYALAYTNNGAGSICATEACQVYKPSNKGGAWDAAVESTKGWVMLANGKPLSAWYAASSGGYNYSYSFNGLSTSGGWDTKCGNQGCWTADAFEKIAGSPWFYKGWYKPRGGNGTRSHPWLNKDEFVDIVNAVLLYKKDSGTISHLSQTDKSNSDTWSRDEVKNRLGGDAVGDVSSISVSYSTGGYTGNVKIQTDKGEKNIEGGTFREIFNIRAPGEIYLASALFNIEKK